MQDVPTNFAPLVGSASSATIEALRELIAVRRAAIHGLTKDGANEALGRAALSWPVSAPTTPTRS